MKREKCLLPLILNSRRRSHVTKSAGQVLEGAHQQGKIKFTARIVGQYTSQHSSSFRRKSSQLMILFVSDPQRQLHRLTFSARFTNSFVFCWPTCTISTESTKSITPQTEYPAPKPPKKCCTIASFHTRHPSPALVTMSSGQLRTAAKPACREEYSPQQLSTQR